MSEVNEDDSVQSEAAEALTWLKDWYHIPSVLLLFVFMLWVRARTWGNFVVNGTVVFSGNDAWYVLRNVFYTVKNYPETIPFEIWTHYPHGVDSGQFGTIYEQVVATAALIVGLGSPSANTVKTVLLFTPAIVGALTVIPAYYLGKRLGKSRFSGILAGLIVALSTGGLLGRSLVGFSDHHVAEAFAQALAALTVVVALQVADDEKPVWELVLDRDIESLRRPLGYGVLAGVGLALYMWVHPIGLLMVGILGIYFTLQLSVHYLRGESPEHIALVGVVMLVVTAFLMLLPLDTLGIATLNFSLLQPGLAIAGAVWCGFLAWLSRFWDGQELPAWTYAATVFGLVFAGLGLFALVLPRQFDFFTSQFSRVFGFMIPRTGAIQTVGETQGLSLNRAQTAFQYWYGFAHIIAGIGVLITIARQSLSKSRSELLFASLWLLVAVSMTLTQAKYSYYLTVPVAVMAAYTISIAWRYISEAMDQDSASVRPYQVMAVITVLLLVMAPMVLVTNQRGISQDVLTQSNDRHNPAPGGYLGWDGGLEWMSENTPAEGNFAGAGNNLDFYGEYQKTGDYDYPKGSYGVLSWWDYGHWITQTAQRIPVANPFQDSAKEAAKFLMAQNETRANNVIETNMSEGTNQETRYVMVDWKMATANAQYGAKFFAPPAFLKGVSRSTYYQPVYTLRQQNNQLVPSRPYFTIQKQAYYETMVNRLYRYHGSAAWPDYVPNAPLRQKAPYEAGSSWVPVVHPALRRVPGGSIPTAATSSQDGHNTTILFRNLQSAQAYVENNSRARIGGLGKFPSEYVPALKHYRLVHATNKTQNALASIQPGLLDALRSRTYTGIQRPSLYTEPYSSWTKTFERVPGATVRGTVPGQPNASVYAHVEMKIPTTNQTFTYVQRAKTGPNGTFTMTLPYSTTGYENWGPKQGYTNVSVRATTSYTFTTRTVFNGSAWIKYNATAAVSEAKVIGEDDSPVTVTLSKTRGSGPSGIKVTRQTSNSKDSGQTKSVEPALDLVGADTKVRTAG